MGGQMSFHLNVLHQYLWCDDLSMNLIHGGCVLEIFESHEKAYIKFPHEIKFENTPILFNEFENENAGIISIVCM